MIKNLKISNFKSWEKVDIEFAPITGLFGTNSSGKSSILQYLLMLKQTKETTDRSLVLDFGGQNSYVNLGSFKDTIYSHDESRSLEWSLRWELSEQLAISDPAKSRTTTLFEGKELQLQTSAGMRGKQLATNYLAYMFGEQKFTLARKNEKESAFNLETKGKNDQFRFIRTLGRAWDLPGSLKSYSFPDQAKTYFQNSGFLSKFELAYENLMDKIFYLGPLREYPKREYIWAGSRPDDVGRRGEKVVDALLSAKANGERRNLGYKRPKKLFEEFIAQWLKDIDLISNFEVEEIAKDSHLYRVRVQAKPYSEKVLITDVGFGVSQFLPVLVLLYYVPEGATVLLEQPEIHLHPAIQSGLADIIVNAVTTRKIQVIVESHSEHLLRRIQRRVAEEVISPEMTKLYFCDVERGKSKLKPLDMDLFGNILNWPQGFFGDDFAEVAAIQKAGLRRKIKARKE